MQLKLCLLIKLDFSTAEFLQNFDEASGEEWHFPGLAAHILILKKKNKKSKYRFNSIAIEHLISGIELTQLVKQHSSLGGWVSQKE